MPVPVEETCNSEAFQAMPPGTIKPYHGRLNAAAKHAKSANIVVVLTIKKLFVVFASIALFAAKNISQ